MVCHCNYSLQHLHCTWCPFHFWCCYCFVHSCHCTGYTPAATIDSSVCSGFITACLLLPLLFHPKCSIITATTSSHCISSTTSAISYCHSCWQSLNASSSSWAAVPQRFPRFFPFLFSPLSSLHDRDEKLRTRTRYDRPYVQKGWDPPVKSLVSTMGVPCQQQVNVMTQLPINTASMPHQCHISATSSLSLT